MKDMIIRILNYIIKISTNSIITENRFKNFLINNTENDIDLIINNKNNDAMINYDEVKREITNFLLLNNVIMIKGIVLAKENQGILILNNTLLNNKSLIDELKENYTIIASYNTFLDCSTNNIYAYGTFPQDKNISTILTNLIILTPGTGNMINDLNDYSTNQLLQSIIGENIYTGNDINLFQNYITNIEKLNLKFPIKKEIISNNINFIINTIKENI